MATKELTDLTWSQRRGCIDLTTVKDNEIDKDTNPVYLIDKRLLDELLYKIKGVSFDDIKEDIKLTVEISSNKEQLFKGLDDYIYMDSIINHPNFPVKEEKDSLPEGN